MALFWTICKSTAAARATVLRLADTNVQACVQRGVNVLQLNLDQGLTLFGDHSFDVVLQIDTLQHLRNAEVMLRETVRVGRIGIVAFPNFGHWPNRLSVLQGPYAGDTSIALPVVRHAQYPRGYVCRLCGLGRKKQTAGAGCVWFAKRARSALVAEFAGRDGCV
jgi:hypothetical protein